MTVWYQHKQLESFYYRNIRLTENIYAHIYTSANWNQVCVLGKCMVSNPTAAGYSYTNHNIQVSCPVLLLTIGQTVVAKENKDKCYYSWLYNNTALSHIYWIICLTWKLPQILNVDSFTQQSHPVNSVNLLPGGGSKSMWVPSTHQTPSALGKFSFQPAPLTDN